MGTKPNAGNSKIMHNKQPQEDQQDMFARSHELSKRRFFERLERRGSLNDTEPQAKAQTEANESGRLQESLSESPREQEQYANPAAACGRIKFAALKQENHNPDVTRNNAPYDLPASCRRSPNRADYAQLAPVGAKIDLLTGELGCSHGLAGLLPQDLAAGLSAKRTSEDEQRRRQQQADERNHIGELSDRRAESVQQNPSTFREKIARQFARASTEFAGTSRNKAHLAQLREAGRLHSPSPLQEGTIPSGSHHGGKSLIMVKADLVILPTKHSSSSKRSLHTAHRCAQYRRCSSLSRTGSSENCSSSSRGLEHLSPLLVNASGGAPRACESGVWGQLVKINKSDGCQVIELMRAPGRSWGFFVARGSINNTKGIFISRMHDNSIGNPLAGLLTIGDQILSIDSLAIDPHFDILKVNQLISKKSRILLGIRPFSVG